MNKNSGNFNKQNIAAAIALLLASSSANADTTLFDDRLKVNFYVAQGFQSIEAKDEAFRPEDREQESNFLRLRANLDLSFQITDHIRAYVDLAEEPNDFGNPDDVGFTINQDFGGIDFELLGMNGYETENETLILSVGNIGQSSFQFTGFQDGAVSQSNPVIGNSPVDFATAESGAQLAYTKIQPNQTIESWRVSGAVTGSSFGEAFQKDRGYNLFVTGTIETSYGVDIGLNYQKADQGDQVDITGDEIASLDGLVTPGYRFGDGENYNFSASATSSRETHVGLSPGLDLEVIALNVRYKPTENTTLIGRIGTAKDDYSFVDVNGDITAFQGATGGAVGIIKQESKIDFYVVEATQYIIPEKFYVAARYANSTNNSPGVNDEDTLDRIQVSAGYWFYDNTLVKVEYVDQNEDANSGGQIGGGFDGFSAEIAVKF
ncbi:hypothetical protein [Alteromonas sp. a30]|uniref:hypothetical protein n=1 Tax=Alteromonas sp. a30 TaxID=2730917 RepID=UPI00227E8B6B|nr:hypothetical protein [Alteromonas sp. a30]MCY7296724.1 hypothetical protein [Alteromonas sp. a30]